MIQEAAAVHFAHLYEDDAHNAHPDERHCDSVGDDEGKSYECQEGIHRVVGVNKALTEIIEIVLNSRDVSLG